MENERQQWHEMTDIERWELSWRSSVRLSLYYVVLSTAEPQRWQLDTWSIEPISVPLRRRATLEPATLASLTLDVRTPRRRPQPECEPSIKPVAPRSIVRTAAPAPLQPSAIISNRLAQTSQPTAAVERSGIRRLLEWDNALPSHYSSVKLQCACIWQTEHKCIKSATWE